MAYGHSSSGHPSLDGVEFRLSDVFTRRPKVLDDDDVDLKDPEVLLEDLEYDFSRENRLVQILHMKEQEEEEKRRNALLREEQKQREIEINRQLFLEKQKETELKEVLRKKTETDNGHKQKIGISANNPFFNDLTGNDILKPQLVNNNDTPASLTVKSNLDVHEFETEDPDPFTNMELKTIDDLQELKDVLQNVSTGSGKQSPEDQRPIATNGFGADQVPSSSNDLAAKNGASTTKKSVLIDAFTDLLTSDIKETEEVESVPTTVQAPEPRKPKPRTSPLPQYFPANDSSFLPSINHAASTPQMSHPGINTFPAELASQRPSSAVDTSSGTPPSSNMTSVEYTETFKLRPVAQGSSSVADLHSGTSVLPSVDSKPKTSDYVNIASLREQSSEREKTEATPRPAVRSKPRKVSKATDSDDGKLKPNSYGAVKHKVLAEKSASERARFEETINKALTSLPQLPKRPKPPQEDSTAISTADPEVAPKPSRVNFPTSPGLLGGLGQDEREFAKSFISMGFVEKDVIRTMQKYGKDHKEVIEHLCILQRLLEQGFATKNIEDALEIFNGNEKEATHYLQLELQFMDMGFSSEKIKEALLLTDRNQSKALEVLMANS